MILAKENIEILKRIAVICEKEPDEPHLFRHASDTELKGVVKEGEFVDGYYDHIGTVSVCHKNKLFGLMAGEDDDEVTLLCYIEKLNKETGEFEREIPFGMTVNEAIESELLGKGDIIRFVDVNGNKVESIEHMDCEDPLGLFFIGVDPVQHQMDMEEMEFDDEDEEECDHHHDEDDDGDEIDTDLGPVSLTNVLSYILEYKDCIEAAASLEEVKDFLQ